MARDAKRRAEGASASPGGIPALGGDRLIFPLALPGRGSEGGRPGEHLLPRHFKGLVEIGGFEASEVSVSFAFFFFPPFPIDIHPTGQKTETIFGGEVAR